MRWQSSTERVRPRSRASLASVLVAISLVFLSSCGPDGSSASVEPEESEVLASTNEDLIEWLDSGDVHDYRVVRAVVELEARLPAAREALVKALSHSSFRVRALAVQMLGRTGNSEGGLYSRFVLMAEEDPHPSVRGQAVTTLAVLDPSREEAMLAFRSGLSSEHSEVRRGARIAALFLGSRAIPDLRAAMLGAASGDVQQAATRACIALTWRHPEKLHLLEPLLQDYVSAENRHAESVREARVRLWTLGKGPRPK